MLETGGSSSLNPDYSALDAPLNAKSKRTTRILLIVVSLFALGLGIGLIVALSRKSAAAHTPCATEDCLELSLRIVKNMDQTAKPCDDFFQYACGGFIDQHMPVLEVDRDAPFSYSDWQRMAESSVKIAKKKLLGESSPGSVNARQLHRLCSGMFDRAVPQPGDEPLAAAERPPLLRPANASLMLNAFLWSISGPLADPSTAFATLNTQGIYAGMFPIVVPDNDNPRKTAVLIAPPHTGFLRFLFRQNTFKTSLGLGSVAHLLKEPSAEERRRAEAAAEVVRRASISSGDDSLLGRDDSWDDFHAQVTKPIHTLITEEFSSLARDLEVGTAEEFAASIQDVEVAMLVGWSADVILAYFTNGRQFLQDAMTESSALSLGEIERAFGSELGVAGGLRRLVDAANGSPVKMTKKVLAQAPDVKRQLSAIPAVKLRQWHVFMALFHHMELLIPDMFALVHGESSRTTDVCADWLIHNSPAAFAAQRAFVDERFSGETRRYAEALMEAVQDEYVTILEGNTFLVAATRATAIEKAKAMTKSVGAPAPVLDDELLAKMDTLMNAGTSNMFLDVFMKVTGPDFLHQITSLTTPTTADWTNSAYSALTMNAFYLPFANRMMFPATFMQSPHVSPDVPSVYSFGGMGVVVGHEISHGFDPAGSFFDKDGLPASWWDTRSYHRYVERTTCVENAYSAYEVAKGIFVNGNKTVGENVSDLGGLKVAWRAWQKWRKTAPKKNLPVSGFQIAGLTREQEFFVGYGQMWCEASTPATIALEVETGVHAPNKARTNVGLANFAPFAEAFNCPAGAPLNPKDKCEVW